MSILRKPIVLSILSGILLTLSWPAIGGMTFLIFGAFIPMLLMEDELYQRRHSIHSKRIFFIAFVGFFLWNLGTTYFILYIREPDVPPIQQTIARITAAGLTYVLNSAFMAIVFWLFHLTRRNVGGVAGYAALVLYWMSFEYIHMQWSINWPWLNLGNVFAQDVQYVQWYEHTGSPGGTLWILLVNLTLFTAIKARWQGRKARSMRM
ncbi:MAG: hypothetical protein HKN79_06780, partial [Flavobacteriales bacterium]|nr:hypothetical protein [Flavobacteriales bacterium]